jgi:hypothetical protein
VVQYSLDGGATWQAYSAPLTAGQTETTVLYRAVDVAGNIETTNRAVLPAVGVTLAPSSTRASLASATVSYGSVPVAQVTVSGNLAQKPSGTVRVLLGSTSVGSGTLAGGKATVKLAKNIAVGTSKLRVVYAGDDRYTGSATDLTLKVVAAASKTSVSAKPTTVRSGKPVRLTVKVTSTPGVKVAGTVRIVAVKGNIKVVRTVRLSSNGTVVVNLGSLTRTGSYKITAQYLGSGTVTTSTSSAVKVKVVR